MSLSPIHLTVLKKSLSSFWIKSLGSWRPSCHACSMSSSSFGLNLFYLLLLLSNQLKPIFCFNHTGFFNVHRHLGIHDPFAEPVTHRENVISREPTRRAIPCRGGRILLGAECKSARVLRIRRTLKKTQLVKVNPEFSTEPGVSYELVNCFGTLNTNLIWHPNNYNYTSVSFPYREKIWRHLEE